MKFNRLTALSKTILLIAICLSYTQGLADSTTNLVAHYVEVIPNGDGISYTINIYFSVLDETDTPIKNLEQKNFAIQEDGSGIDIQSLRTIKDEPLNVILLVDTSKNMNESDIKNATDAASSFINQLKPNDQVALIAFDDSPRNQNNSEFSIDRNEIATKINGLSRSLKAGACIYDAVNAAVKLFPAQTTGSRAVILLTKHSKNDPSTDTKCNYKADEITNTASDNLPTPIYIYTLGLKLDTSDDNEKKNIQALQELATKTGGFFKHLSTSDKLTNTFNFLSEQLKSQYILSYQSTSTAGDHTLLVSVTKSNQATPASIAQRKFTLSPLPPLITFTSPLNNDNIGDTLKLAVMLTKQDSVVIKRVVFKVNGNEVDEDTTKPYELELDTRQYPIGFMIVSAIAYGPDDNPLTPESSVNLTHVESADIPTLIPTNANVPIPQTSTSETPKSNNSVIYILIALSAFSILAIGSLIFYLLRQQNRITFLDVDNFPDEAIAMPVMRSIPTYPKTDESRRASNIEVASDDVLGALTIEASDDSSLIGTRFEIRAPLVSLGRSADNDINFPNDKPVSRHHAEIYQIGGNLYLREVATADSSGTAKPPKYGTFLNRESMGEDATLLKTGDEIQLGKRVRLKFESFSHITNTDALTYDEGNSLLTSMDGDTDKTSIQD